MRRTLLTLLTTGLVGLLMAALSAPAEAATRRISDPRGDVLTATFTGEETEDDLEFTPSRTSNGDVRWTQLRYSRNAVQLKVRYYQLRRSNELTLWSFQLRGSNGQRRDLELAAGQLAPRGDSRLTRRNGRPVCGKAVREQLNYRTDTITATMPRRCVGSPRSVQVRGLGYWMRGVETESETFDLFVDDITRKGGTASTFGAGWTPMVRRG